MLLAYLGLQVAAVARLGAVEELLLVTVQRRWRGCPAWRGSGRAGASMAASSAGSRRSQRVDVHQRAMLALAARLEVFEARAPSVQRFAEAGGEQTLAGAEQARPPRRRFQKRMGSFLVRAVHGGSAARLRPPVRSVRHAAECSSAVRRLPDGGRKRLRGGCGALGLREVQPISEERDVGYFKAGPDDVEITQRDSASGLLPLDRLRLRHRQFAGGMGR
jgi:hypothetical protein